jgi:hypothetical protein
VNDPETCSRCLTEVEWTDLNHVPATGENVCDRCIADNEETEPVS